MTLTNELKDQYSPASTFLSEWLPDRSTITTLWAEQIARLPAVVTSLPWHARSTVGSAFDRRVGFDLADDAPYLDVLQLIPPDDAARMLTAAGMEPQASDAVIAADTPWNWRRRTDWTPPDVDEEMDRDCWYLSQYAAVLRRTRSPDPETWRGVYTAMRDLVYRDDLLSEVVAAMRTLWRTYLIKGRHRLHQLGESRVIGPTFDDAFAVGDLVLGSTLVEIKTYVDPTDSLCNFLDQLLGYVLFDAEDRYAINAVAVYLAWHGELLTVPLAEALQLASGQANFDLTSARHDFRKAVAPALEISHIYKHGATAQTRSVTGGGAHADANQ